MKILSRNAGWLDYILAAIAAILAVYSTSMGIGQPKIGYFFAGGIIAGSLFSYLMGRVLLNKPWIKIDGLLYAIFAVCTVLLARPLNSLLPEGGYTLQLMVGGVLSWMLMLGSFATWRDYTILFQAVPTIALFGLGGVWDTFKGATIMFFLFLLCTATLFARAHARNMLDQALESGYMGRRRDRSSSPESRDDSIATRLAQGPWRWMAGPEWALASAVSIIIVSIIGAPLFKSSLEAVAGTVRITLPTPASTSPSTPSFSTGRTSMEVGQGPRRLVGAEVLKVKIDVPRYLKGSTFETYKGNGWEREPARYFESGEDAIRWFGTRSNARPFDPRDIIKNFKEVEYEIIPISGVHEKLYLPGEMYRMPGDRAYRVLLDGTVAPAGMLDFKKAYSASAIVPDPSVQPEKTGDPLGHYAEWVPTTTGRKAFLDAAGAPSRVRELALSATKGAKTDYEKALRIKAQIESMVEYDLNAPPVPPGKDAVEFFLFESKRGYCDLFASSMALMARAAGLPSRVVSGFLITDGKKNPAGFFTIRDSDYHAWAEIFFDGIGWVEFDPTEGAPEVGGLPSETTSWYASTWFRSVLAVMAVAAIGISGWLGWKYLVARKSPDSKIGQSNLGRLYGRFERLIAKKVHKPRRLHLTPREYLVASGPALGASESLALKITNRFESAFYSKSAIDTNEARELSSWIREFSKMDPNRPRPEGIP